MATKTMAAPGTEGLRAANRPTPKAAVAAYLRPSGMRMNRNWTAVSLSRLLEDICGKAVTEEEVIKIMTSAGFRSEKGKDGTLFDVNSTQIVRMADELAPHTKREL